jgi:solute carrier family 25 iron transporter 28/37
MAETIEGPVELEWEEWDPASGVSFATHMVAGSFAGLAEHLCMFPVDTLRTNIQCDKCGSVTPFQTVSCAKKMVQRDGLLRLWRGVNATFTGCIPGQ